MRRRDFITALGGAAALPFAAQAQKVKSTPRLGVLSASQSLIEDGFWHGMRELGYEPGRNLIVETRFGIATPDRLIELAGELVAAKVDIIFSAGSQATRAVQQSTATIPVVMTSTNPLGLGFVKSLARPDGNITGLSIFGPEVSGKRLELLKEMIPGISRVAVFWNPDDPAAQFSLRETETIAGSIGLSLQILQVRGVDAFADVMLAASNGGAQAVVMLPAPLLSRNADRLASLALQRGLPTLFYTSETVRAGALIAYGASLTAIYRRAAYYVDRIIKGARPADLPVEQPTKFELVINLKTAKALGLTVPPLLLARADEVIE